MMYDNIARNATTFSHRLSAENGRLDLVSNLNENLKALRVRSGLSVRKLAAALGVPASTYAAYEDPGKFKKPILPLDFAKRLADQLVLQGIERSDVLALAGINGSMDFVSADRSRNEQEDGWIMVQGSVAAGIWKEQSDWPISEQYEVRFGKSRYPEAQRFAVRMEGLSMNRTVPSGSDIECLYTQFSDYPPAPGDLVIVERSAHDLVELTCKRLAMIGSQYALVCESSEPEFQEPIFIGSPDNQDYTDNGIRIVGIVLSAKLDLAPKGLSERRYRQ